MVDKFMPLIGNFFALREPIAGVTRPIRDCAVGPDYSAL
jgi:hypothetical protein